MKKILGTIISGFTCIIGMYTSTHCMHSDDTQPNKKRLLKNCSSSSSSSSLAPAATKKSNNNFTLRTAALFNRLPEDAKDLIWDNLRTWQQAKRIEAHSSQVTCLSYCPDGTQLASGSWDHSIKIWDASTGQCVQTIGKYSQYFQDGHEDDIAALSYCPDGLQLASASADGIIKIWDPATAKCLQTIDINTGFDLIDSLAYCRNGTQLACASESGKIKIWNPITKECLRTIEKYNHDLPDGTYAVMNPDGHKDWITYLYCSPNGAELVSEAYNSDIPHKLVYPIFSPDGPQLAFASEDSIRILNPTTGRCVKTIATPSHTSPWGYVDKSFPVCYCPNSTYLITCSYSSIELWDTVTAKCLQIIVADYGQSPESRFGCLNFSPDGTQFATGSNSGLIKIWKRLSSDNEEAHLKSQQDQYAKKFQHVLTAITMREQAQHPHKRLEQK